MSRYAAKPAPFDAVQWTHELRFSELPDWISEALNKNPGTPGSIFRWGDRLQVFLSTGGLLWAVPGDWVVRRGENRLSVCDEKSFAETYEPVIIQPQPPPIKSPEKAPYP